MKNYITALNLCVDKDHWRRHFHRPFRIAKHLCACNGKILLCIPDHYFKQSTLKHYGKAGAELNIQRHIDEAKNSETKTLSYTLSRLQALFSQAANEPIYECKDCSGTGRVVYEYLSRTDDTYELEGKCPICNGNGKICNGIEGKKKQTAFRYASGLPLISISLTHTLMQVLQQLNIEKVTIAYAGKDRITLSINSDITIVVMGIFVDENVHKHWDIIDSSQCVELPE